MLLRYVYADHNGSKQLVGCVLKTDEGRLGYSAVHPKDRHKLTKKLARTIALGRAEKCEIYGVQPPGDWYRMRAGLNSARVPRTIVPYLAVLAIPQPPTITPEDLRTMTPEEHQRWIAGSKM